MQFQPVFGKSILLGASVCSIFCGCAVFSGCAVTGPVAGTPVPNGPIHAGPVGSPWEDPCSPDWPAACMPDLQAGPPTPVLAGLARLPHHQGLPDAPPYPRFHPLPTRPMLSPRPEAIAIEELAPLDVVAEPASFGTLP